ncbi:MAG: LemA family protein, partial [Flavobacteriaceae bacterium]|nr:LemA family protein [Flavobacteriaceae bacterium]
MKKWLIPLIIIALLVLYGVSTYNSMIPKRNATEKQWANVENAYQRRADLIPNLVSTVQGAADFEKETLEGVISARAKATQTTIDPSNIT